MKKLITIFFLLLIAGCTAPTVELEQVTNESIIEELPQVVEEIIEEETTEEDENAPFYTFEEGETKEILGHSIELITIHQDPIIDVVIDGTQTTIKETKSEEIIDDLKILIQEINDEYKEQKTVILKIENLDLGDNEYIIRKNQRIKVNDKEILLEKSKVNGYIQVSVYNKGTLIGDTQDIKKGETKTINGLAITNLKNYYKVEQYAWIIAE